MNILFLLISCALSGENTTLREDCEDQALLCDIPSHLLATYCDNQEFQNLCCHSCSEIIKPNTSRTSPLTLSNTNTYAWTEWSEWNPCKNGCRGLTTRSRTCQSQSKLSKCEGPRKESRRCSESCRSTTISQDFSSLQNTCNPNHSIRKDEKCSCTTKGVIGVNCYECDSEFINSKGLLAGASKNGTCYYPIVSDFEYTFKARFFKPEQDKYVSKLNCQVTPVKTQPDVEIYVKTEDQTIGVNITTLVGDGQEELVTFGSSTKDFRALISSEDYNFGSKSNRSLRIYIYDFEPPLAIKVGVTQQ